MINPKEPNLTPYLTGQDDSEQGAEDRGGASVWIPEAGQSVLSGVETTADAGESIVSSVIDTISGIFSL